MDPEVYQVIYSYATSGAVPLGFLRRKYSGDPALALLNFKRKASRYRVQGSQLVNKDGHVVVKADEVDRILSELYKDIAGGRDKLLYELKRRTLSISKRKVEAWLKSNEAHQRELPLRNMKRVSRPIKSGAPHERWQFDITELPKDLEPRLPLRIRDNDTEGEKIYLFTLVDHFSRYTWLWVEVSSKADVIAEHMLEVIGEHGIPSVLQSDNGSNIRSAVTRVNEYLEEQSYGPMKHILSSPYSSRSQGMVELANRKSKQLISHYVMAYPREDLDTILQRVMKAMNTSYNSTLRMAPDEALSRRKDEAKTNIDKRYNKIMKSIDVLTPGTRVRYALKTLDPSRRSAISKGVRVGEQNWSEVCIIDRVVDGLYILESTETKELVEISEGRPKLFKRYDLAVM